MTRILIVFVLLAVLFGCTSSKKEMAVPGEPALESTRDLTDTAPAVTGYDDSQFVDDITIPDNMVIEKGKKFLKTWRLYNSGTTTWKGYKLAFSRGDRIGAPESVSVNTTPPGDEADITVPMQAPKEPGTYTGYWQLQNPGGESFGVTMWVLIEVK